MSCLNNNSTLYNSSSFTNISPGLSLSSPSERAEVSRSRSAVRGAEGFIRVGLRSTKAPINIQPEQFFLAHQCQAARKKDMSSLAACFRVCSHLCLTAHTWVLPEHTLDWGGLTHTPLKTKAKTRIMNLLQKMCFLFFMLQMLKMIK